MTDEQKVKEAIKKLRTGKKLSYQEAIDLKCLECFNYQANDVKKCNDKECVLFYYKTLTNRKK